MDPEGKIALVTGGSNGIGLATVKELLKHGVKGVSICDINEESGKAVQQELQQEFGKDKVLFIKTDVANENEFKNAFKNTLKQFGSLDIVVNSAGIIDDQNWRKEIEVNLIGVIQGNLLALEYLGKDKEGRGGVVVNIASIAGLMGGTAAPIYSATKSAVVGLTRHIGSDFIWEMTGVRVISVCPGLTDTNLVRNVTPDSHVTYRKEWMPELMQNFQKFEMQKEKYVGAAVVHTIREGKSGSIWVAENSQSAYEINIPPYSDIKI